MLETPIIPRVSETDGAGHVNNVFVPVWLEAGRREIFRIFTPDLSFRRWRVALVNLNLDYLEQIYFHREAVVRTSVERVGGKSFTLYEEVWQEERRCAKGSATYVCFDYEAARTEPIAPECRMALEAHLRDA